MRFDLIREATFKDRDSVHERMHFIEESKYHIIVRLHYLECVYSVNRRLLVEDQFGFGGMRTCRRNVKAEIGAAPGIAGGTIWNRQMSDSDQC